VNADPAAARMRDITVNLAIGNLINVVGARATDRES